ncbi:MAG: orotidine-5'-phosphate decarboxylase [Kiritimatiellae bacterium]|nr:orotidine-5'-phosphate decarboxylase [Kiritimatiellia bacterium]
MMKPELIIALDVPSSDKIPAIIDALPPAVQFYKVGLELFVAEGPLTFNYLLKSNKKIFLDLKLHDIPRTVARAVASAAKHGVNLLTVHAGGGREMLRAAAESAGEHHKSNLKIVAVTTLTSLNDADLTEIGVSRPLIDHTLALGELAVSAGIDGLVCSPNEASVFRKRLGNKPILITPGIRPAGANAGDQKRIATPEFAVNAGANFLVVGRPILEAPDPRFAAEEILRQMGI